QFGITSAYTAGAFLAKRNPQGDVLWQRVLAFGGTWSPVGMAVAPDGTVYFTGQLGANYSSGTVVGKVLSDGTLAFSKFTSAFVESGTLLHERRLDLPNDEYGWSVTLGPDGDPYYLGFSYQNYDPISARFTPDLVPQWTEYVGSPTLYDYGWRIVSAGDATFFVQGTYYNYQNGDSGSVTYRLDSSGA